MYFNCENKYTLGHKCKNQRLFKLDIFPEEEGEQGLEREEEIEYSELKTIKLSLNSITGVSSIRLVGRINDKGVEFLVDTEATHNFADPMMVEKLQLKGLKVDSFEMTVAGGEKIVGVHCCRDVKLNIQGKEREADLLVISLGDAQIILGTMWLRKLGPTTWDFLNHTLRYWQGEKPITLRGVRPSPVELIEGESLGRILKQGVAVFVL